MINRQSLGSCIIFQALGLFSGNIQLNYKQVQSKKVFSKEEAKNRNSRMLIENKGIRRNNFYVPPFYLKEGEIIVLYLYNGLHFYDTAMLLQAIFSGKANDEHVIVHKHLTFVEHFKEPTIRRLFFPVTVKEYLKTNANMSSPFAKKIYENKWIKETTKVNTLAGNPRKQLSLYATLSRTNNVIFDVVGQDPGGAELTYKIVKQVVKEGGAAILLDSFEDMKNDCTKYIELQWTK